LADASKGYRQAPDPTKEYTMSIDAKFTKDLMQTVEDGRNGFADAADKLVDTDRSDLAPRFREFSEQRSAMYVQLETLAASYGDDLDEDGSVAATLHRGWMGVKDALAGSSAGGVLDVAEQGEEHAVKKFRAALDEELSPELAELVRRQLVEITAVHDEVKRLAAA
jgi:uncharacterized protein (TIGR02284 family)